MSTRLVVTGGGSGMGAAVAQHAAARGAQVCVLDIADADSVGDGENITYVPCDVTDYAVLEGAFDQASAAMGGIDGVYAAAGSLGVMAPLEELTPEEWRRTMALNLDGFYFTVRAAATRMSSGGGIVGTSSVAGSFTFAAPGGLAYATAKAGVIALARSAAVELARFGIRINVIAPGKVVGTRLLTQNLAMRGTENLAHERLADIPLAGETTADDVVNLVEFLLSDEAARITGTVIPLDAGQSLLGGGMLKERPAT